MSTTQNQDKATAQTSFDHSLSMACEHLESIGCDGNAIELREKFAALVAVAEAASKLHGYISAGHPAPWGELAAQAELKSALANLAAVREGK